MMLWNQWLPFMSGLAGTSMVLAFGHLQIAALVSGDGGRWLVYFLAAFFGWSFALYLCLGGSQMLGCLSVLREAQGDRPTPPLRLQPLSKYRALTGQGLMPSQAVSGW